MTWLCGCGNGELSTFGRRAIPLDVCPGCGTDLTEMKLALEDEEEIDMEEMEAASEVLDRLERPRRIVRLAAEKTETEAAKEWLRTDERGVFETMAKEMLEGTKERAERLSLTPESVDKCIALAITVAAVEALFRRATELEV